MEQLLNTLNLDWCIPSSILSAKILNTIGLFLNIIGGILIFFFGFPQPNLEEGVSLGLELNNPLKDGRTVEQYNRDIQDKRTKYKRRSQFALMLILIGFVWQVVAIWICV